MRLGLASLLVALSSLLAPPPHCFTLAVTPPDDFTYSPADNHDYQDKEPNCTLCRREENYLDGKGASTNNYGIGGSRQKLSTGNLKTEDKNRTKLTVGYLTAIKGDLNGRQGIQISGAIQMALDEVNNDPHLLRNVKLELKWNDTRGDTVLATRAMTDMICDGVAAFFGPEGTCYVEAIVSQARNIPMFSYKCSDYKASTVPTFARTEPPDTQVTKSVLALISYYKWSKFAIIYNTAYASVASSLREHAEEQNMTVTSETLATDSHKCCSENLPCCQLADWYKIIQDTKNKTRIYVFLGTIPSLLELMNKMETVGLFENGDYIVIYVDMNTYSDQQAHKYIWTTATDTLNKYHHCTQATTNFERFRRRAKSLFVVAPTGPTDNYNSFTHKVKEYNGKEPFNFVTSDYLKPYVYETFVTINAAYLFDAVKLYSSALHYLLEQVPKKDLNDKIILDIASNGTKIIETVIKINSTYTSIIGTTMKLDKNGDSEGNFSVIAYTEPENTTVLYNFSCPFQFRPVGQFFQSDDEGENVLPRYEKIPNIDIFWPNGNRLNDEPSCGFANERCPKPNTQMHSIIAAGVLLVMLFCAGVIIMSIYRKWKIEQEIEGLLWKINREEILNYFEKDIISSPSRLSLASASVTSYESRGGLQVFATTAQYRGVVVRIKELNFSRKKDISREVMKEMRLLRELRHDNVNSFIGACVQPSALYLVTDYCAKGSLYDIIENEDIKLDKMFIASLVHDLIKGMLYIHNSMLLCHGNLKSSNCVVTSRWVLQVTDFGLAEMRHCAESDSIGEHQYYRSLFWKAPEILRDPIKYIKGTQKGDVYSFGIILYEIIGRRGPFGITGYEPKDIIELIKKDPYDEEPFRPDIDLLMESEIACDDYVLQCMKECWAENPDARPDFVTIRSKLKRMKGGKNRNIMDQMMDMMVTYANNLEELVNERTRLLNEEKMKTEDLLHRMLPKPVAEKLTRGLGVEPESFDFVTIYFSDIVGFTAMSAESTPLQVVNFLNDLYTVFDGIIKGYDVYKVETIGDAYMVVSGLPLKNGDRHAGEIASMALDLLAAVKNHSIIHRPKDKVELRIGIHTGPVVAGVVGLTMPRYCLFGDTVNTASRMESNGEPLKIHISQQCKEALEKIGGYEIEERGIVNMKGKGQVKTFWLVGANDQAVQKRAVDLENIPPLFCRPRRSPKLTADSRQASICGGFSGLYSRRHSSVPRGTSVEVESISTLQNMSPIPSRHMKVNRNNLHVPDPTTGSKLTINTAFGSQTVDNVDDKRISKPRRILYSIASSSDDHNKSQGMLNRTRESKSLDPIPVGLDKPNKPLDLIDKFLQSTRRATKSLENCQRCGEIQIIAIPDDKLTNNNFPNGNLMNSVPLPSYESNPCLEDVQVPLLNATKNPSIVRKRGGSTVDDIPDNDFLKRWHSLEAIPACCDKLEARNTNSILKTWFAGLINRNAIKSSNTSLKKGVLNDYNNLQPEKESIV